MIESVGESLQGTPNVLNAAQSLTNSDTTDGVFADFRCALDNLEHGKLEGFDGEYVAFLQGQIEGHDSDPTKLRANVAQRCSVESERVVLVFVEPRTL